MLAEKPELPSVIINEFRIPFCLFLLLTFDRFFRNSNLFGYFLFPEVRSQSTYRMQVCFLYNKPLFFPTKFSFYCNVKNGTYKSLNAHFESMEFLEPLALINSAFITSNRFNNKQLYTLLETKNSPLSDDESSCRSCLSEFVQRRNNDIYQFTSLCFDFKSDHEADRRANRLTSQ